MKKIITAVLLLVFCLQTAGCSALAVMTSKSQADNGQFVSASPSKLAKELIAASANSDWDNYPSRSYTSTKTKGSRTETELLRDLLKEYGYSNYYIQCFFDNQKKITEKEFEQICKNIESISGDKYILSGNAKNEILKRLSWDDLAQPLAPSYLKLVEKDEYFAVHINNIPIHNEKNASAALENYNFLKNTGVLDNKAIYNVIYTTDWSTYNGKNYALRLTNLMKESNLYTKKDINKVVETLDWGLIKNDPPASAKTIIKKGYIKYLFEMKGNVPVDNTVLTNFEKILDFMKENNFNEYTIQCLIRYSNWGKSDETLAILKILVEQKKTSSKYIKNIFYDPESLYTIYETVVADNSIKDKNKEIIKRFNKVESKIAREDFFHNTLDTTGSVGAGTVAVVGGVAAVATAPVWIPIILLLIGINGIDHH